MLACKEIGTCLQDGGDLRIDCITLAPHLAQMRLVHPYYNLDAHAAVKGG